MSERTDIEEDRVLADIVRRLRSAYNPRLMYLFGSRASGEAGPQSDYDILIVIDESDQPMHRRSRMAYEALAGVEAAVDVLVWTAGEFEEGVGVTTSLPASVVRDGRILHAA